MDVRGSRAGEAASGDAAPSARAGDSPRSRPGSEAAGRELFPLPAGPAVEPGAANPLEVRRSGGRAGRWGSEGQASAGHF